jgi:hypothetical protein
MPAKNLYHDSVRTALIRDGWSITDDPLRLKWGEKDLYVDLGAEKIIGAEKNGRKIAVEVKSFIGPSDVHDLEEAVGQYVLYSSVMELTEPERVLYLAIRRETWKEVFSDSLGKLVTEKQHLHLLVFDDEQEEIVQWIP